MAYPLRRRRGRLTGLEPAARLIEDILPIGGTYGVEQCRRDLFKGGVGPRARQTFCFGGTPPQDDQLPPVRPLGKAYAVAKGGDGGGRCQLGTGHGRPGKRLLERVVGQEECPHPVVGLAHRDIVGDYRPAPIDVDADERRGLVDHWAEEGQQQPQNAGGHRHPEDPVPAGEQAMIGFEKIEIREHVAPLRGDRRTTRSKRAMTHSVCSRATS